MRFGRQRPPGDIAAFFLLLTGFTGLALAFWMGTQNWMGLLLPIGFLIGAYASFRGDVREIELLPDVLLLRTFFREYRIPRAHVKQIARTDRGAAIDVLNGNRYYITPADEDEDEVAAALEEWLAGAR